MQAQTCGTVLSLGLQMMLWKGVHVPLVLCHISHPLVDGDLSFSMAQVSLVGSCIPSQRLLGLKALQFRFLIQPILVPPEVTHVTGPEEQPPP